MFLEVCRIKKQKSLKIRYVTLFHKNFIEQFFQRYLRLIHDNSGILWYFSIKKLSNIVETDKTVIGIESRDLRFLKIKMRVWIEFEISFNQLYFMWSKAGIEKIVVVWEWIILQLEKIKSFLWLKVFSEGKHERKGVV